MNPRSRTPQAAMALSAAALILALWALPLPAQSTSEGAEVEDGREVFVKKNCSHCHSVTSEGIVRGNASKKMQGSDLSDVGARYSKEEMLLYLKRGDVLPDYPVAGVRSVDKSEHWKTFWGTPEEAEALVEWLVQLRQEKQADEATSQE